MFEDIAFVGFYITVFITGVYLYRKACGNLFYPSIIMLFFWFYVVFFYSGTILLYFGLIKLYINMGVTNKNILWLIWINTALGFIIIPLVFILLKEISKVKAPSYIKKFTTPKTIHSQVILLLLFLISLIPFIIYLKKLPNIPILLAISGASREELQLARELAGNLFLGKYHWYKLFFLEIIPFLTYVSFFDFLAKRSRLLYLFLPVSVFACIVSLQKGPIIIFLFSLIFVYYLYKKSAIPLKTIIKVSIIFLLLLIIMYSLFMIVKTSKYGIIGVFSSIFRRVLTGQIMPLYFYYKMFPEHVGYLLGASFPNPMRILPFEPYHLTVEVSRYVHPEGITGSMPTVFWGEMYANFGHGIAFLSMVIMGVILFFAEYLILPISKKNYVAMSFYVWFAFHIPSIRLSSLLTDIYLWGVAAFAITLIILSQIVYGAAGKFSVGKQNVLLARD